MLKNEYPSFKDFYNDVHGFMPYEWQNELAEEVIVTGVFPDQVEVPTGMGKTSLVDISLWSLGYQLHHGQRRTLGQRIFVAVERQVIVEGISSHVKKLVETLNNPSTVTAKTVADALLSLSIDGIAVKEESFHGTKKSSGEWLNATGVTIVSTTVTQITLRLLGQVPDSSPRVGTVHAGLIAKDGIILIDEPHLVSPQVTTIRQILNSEKGLSQLCIMGATIPNSDHDMFKNVFKFDQTKENNQAKKRTRFKKDLTVKSLGKKSSIKEEAKKIVKEYIKNDQNIRIAIIVNTVKEARELSKTISKTVKSKNYDVITITSEIRGAERPSPDELKEDRQIIVATQTVEAGVDFSSDVLITEIAPIPSIWQRIGRLNRDGLSSIAKGYILIPTEQKMLGTKASRSIYGSDAIYNAAKGLLSFEGNIDACVSEQKNIERKISEYLECEASDLWPPQDTPAQFNKDVIEKIFSLSSSPRVDLDAFLEGIKQTQTSKKVRICWREPVLKDTLEGLKKSVQVLPPLNAETIDAKLDDIRKWLKENENDFIVLGDNEDYKHSINPGDTVVVNASLGGLNHIGFDTSEDGASTVRDLSHVICLNEDAGYNNKFFCLTTQSLTFMGCEFINIHDYYERIEKRNESVIDILNELIETISQATGYGVEIKSIHGVLCARRKPHSSSKETSPLRLDVHLSQVAGTIKDYCSLLKIDETTSSSLLNAGLFHDLGKSNVEFQKMLGNSDFSSPLAKSVLRKFTQTSDLKKGFLHEISGARYASEVKHDKLASWLIYNHHGRFRGVDKNNPETVLLYELHHKLQREHGTYGLLYLEAIVRCADWVSSAYPDYEYEVHEDVRKSLESHFDVSSIYQRSVESSIELRGLLGSHIPSWYAVLGLLYGYKQLYGKECYVKWDRYVPHISISETELRAVLEYIDGKLDLDADYFEALVSGFSNRWENTRQYDTVNIKSHNVHLFYDELNGNVYQNFMASWLQSLAREKKDTDVGKWRFVTPFLPGNSGTFKNEDIPIDVESMVKAITDPFFGWVNDKKSVYNLNLAGSSETVNYYIYKLALFGGGFDTPLVTEGIGSTSKGDRMLPFPNWWVSLEELTLLAYGCCYWDGKCPMEYVFGRSNGEKAKKIGPGAFSFGN